jgi:uncharacterized protein (TIGR02117 family)
MGIKLHWNLFAINSWGRAARALFGWLFLLAGLYMAAALIGSLIPRNGDWVEAKAGEGVTIYIYDNGVHTSFILPRNEVAKNNDGANLDPAMLFIDEPLAAQGKSPVASLGPDGLNDAIKNTAFPGDPATYPYVMVGWGDARFYRDTPRWSDIRPGTAVAAVAGSGEALIHVDRIKRLPRAGLRILVLRGAEYDALLSFIERQMPRNEYMFAAPSQPGYGADDRFFVALDVYQYSAFFTCNNWVSEGLAQAGIKTGTWTPLPFGVMWWH